MPFGLSSLPVRAHQQVEPGLAAVHRSEVREAVGALISDLIHPEATLEVRDLNHDRLAFQREDAEAVDDVLVGTCDKALLRLDIVAQHRELVARRNRDDAAHQARLRQVLERGSAVVQVGHRPRPEIGEASQRAHILLAHARTGNGPATDSSPGVPACSGRHVASAAKRAITPTHALLVEFIESPRRIGISTYCCSARIALAAGRGSILASE